jgi:membrane-associated phospholipid phosphatase
MDQKEERIFPLMVTGIFYFMMYYIIRQSQMDAIYNMLFLGSALLIAIALIISFYWKISMHMIGAGGMLGAITGVNLAAYVDLTLFVILAAVICGLVGFARLKLNAHTPAQVYAGFFAGFSLMLALFLI